jgi:DNA invertase Pin-like site-specific DNA recombinase|tara:strand:- start:1385 stop:2176 length:792 start_codon:yes stop_codon:yes gene_type:complete
MIAPIKQVNNIYGYVRVSSEQQVTDGSSLEEQKRIINEFVLAKFERPVDKFFVDAGVSGMKDLVERPGSRELTDVMDYHDVIVTTKLDRLARSFIEMVNMIPTLEETGITLYFCEMFGDIPVVLPKEKESTGLAAKLDMSRINNRNLVATLAQFAEFERDMIRSRLSAGKIAWAEKGYSIGGHVPFGYKKEYEDHGSRRHTKLVPIPEEQAVLKTIYALRDRGLGARKIAKQVSNLHPGFEDFKFTKVSKILNRKFQGLPEAS